MDQRRVPRRCDGDRRAAAAERLRLGVAHLPGAAARAGLLQVLDGEIAGAVALAALAAAAALAVFCFVKVVGLVLLGPPRHAVPAVEAPVAMRAAVVALAGACVVLGLAPGLLFASLVGLAPWPAAAPRPRSAWGFRVRARCPRPGSRRHAGPGSLLRAPARPAQRGARADLDVRASIVGLGCSGRARGSRSRCD